MAYCIGIDDNSARCYCITCNIRRKDAKQEAENAKHYEFYSYKTHPTNKKESTVPRIYNVHIVNHDAQANDSDMLYEAKLIAPNRDAAIITATAAYCQSLVVAAINDKDDKRNPTEILEGLIDPGMVNVIVTLMTDCGS